MSVTWSSPISSHVIRASNSCSAACNVAKYCAYKVKCSLNNLKNQLMDGHLTCPPSSSSSRKKPNNELGWSGAKLWLMGKMSLKASLTTFRFESARSEHG